MSPGPFLFWGNATNCPNSPTSLLFFSHDYLFGFTNICRKAHILIRFYLNFRGHYAEIN
ncbi:hypothetical protein SAMN02745220_02356 [Desulfopila aestuarii DSM 18488]|uniref:Uncharacterized protein n=1 Tax=Desulfopila aestuarii DSM 18488 TaxID=1121416 RepID=A0A1M7Y7F0_9BACT|nr:hypothetical protein SAMN02745220_02356 [Desulfopila aestuarii DSM 18488]